MSMSIANLGKTYAEFGTHWSPSIVPSLTSSQPSSAATGF